MICSKRNPNRTFNSGTLRRHVNDEPDIAGNWQAYSLLYVVAFFFLACPILFLSLIGQLYPITANQSKRLDARAVRDQTNGSRISGEREKVSMIPAILWKMPRLKCLESFKLAAYFRTYQLYYNVNDI